MKALNRMKLTALVSRLFLGFWLSIIFAIGQLAMADSAPLRGEGGKVRIKILPNADQLFSTAYIGRAEEHKHNNRNNRFKRKCFDNQGNVNPLCVGPQGEQGLQGEQGPQGQNGVSGADGADGFNCFDDPSVTDINPPDGIGVEDCLPISDTKAMATMNAVCRLLERANIDISPEGDFADLMCPRSFNYVFVTNDTYDGDLITQANSSPINANIDDGLVAEDAICQYHASISSNPEIVASSTSFRAWLSSSTVNAKDRINPDLVYRRHDGITLVNAGDLGEILDNPILVDETGSQPSGEGVWTGTLATGIAANFHCMGWSSSNESGIKGDKTRFVGGWTSSGATGCEQMLSLYCFEQ